MTRYRFRTVSANVLFAILVFAVMAFGAVERWALTVVEVSVFLLALAWVLRGLWRPFPLKGSHFAWPILAILLMAVLQSLAGWTVDVYQTSGEAIKWTAFLLYFLMWTNLFQDETIRRRFSTVLTWFGFSLAILALVQFYSSPDLLYWFRPAPGAEVFGPFVDRNHYAALMELIVPGALLLAMRRDEKQLLHFVLCGLILASAVICASRAGAAVIAVEVILVTGVTLVTGRRFRESARELAKVLALIALAVGLTFVAGTQRLLDRFRDLDRDLNRAEVSIATWELTKDRLWTGYGLGTFQLVFPSVAPFDDGHRWNHAHNDPLQFGMELGVLGLLCQVSLIGLLVVRKHRREVWLANVLPLAGIWAHSWVEFPLQMPGLVLVVLAILAQVPSRERPRQRERSSPRRKRSRTHDSRVIKAEQVAA